jgi:hypothetical protein
MAFAMILITEIEAQTETGTAALQEKRIVLAFKGWPTLTARSLLEILMSMDTIMPTIT